MPTKNPTNKKPQNLRHKNPPTTTCPSEHRLIEPRGYQKASIDSASKALSLNDKVLIVAPTGSGKSIIISSIIDRALQKNKNKRILVLAHQGHLLVQLEKTIKKINSDIDTGIYCASENRKEFWSQIVFASRDSLGRKPSCAGQFDIIIIDEAHVVSLTCGSESDDTYYSRIIKTQAAPKIIGLTATPWRLGNGLIYGQDCFFESLAFDIKMDDLITEGYLCRPVFPDSKTKVIDTKNIKITNGDFNKKELEKVTEPDPIIDKCLSIWEAESLDRKVSLFFCCSRVHGQKVKAKIESKIIGEVLYIDGELSGENRVKELDKIKKGHYEAIVNIGVLTTGFDAPIIDCIVFLRATASASLFVQMAGRGLRTNKDKKNCLMLDMAGNFERFGSIQKPWVPEKRSSKENVLNESLSLKMCPSCGEYLAPATTQCPICYHIFLNHSDKAYHKGPIVHEVFTHHLMDAVTRNGEHCIVVIYKIDMLKSFSEYLMINRVESWAVKHKTKYNQLKQWKPKIIKVDNTKNNKYPNISIMKWDVMINRKDECNHLFVDAHFDKKGGKKITCNNCGMFI